MAPIRRGQLPQVVQDALKTAKIGEIIGPFKPEKRYCLLRVESFQVINLDEPLKRELQGKLFSKWLQEQLEEIEVSLVKEIYELNSDKSSDLLIPQFQSA